MTGIDALLLLMTLIWGTNYSIVKNAFAEMDAQAFNAMRMVIASAVFLAVILLVRSRRPSPRATRCPPSAVPQDSSGSSRRRIIPALARAICSANTGARTSAPA